ncbi:MAG: HNH endonuclease, partial [Actinobacteria bacterium]|nr:HNH endonuclease [Actinomycetota bacterium]
EVFFAIKIWRNRILFSGENHSNWKYGKSVYRRILIDASQNKFCNLCRILDMRILVVHHKDHNRENNKVDNLMWLCLNCHFLVHHDEALERKTLESSTKIN